MRRVAMVLAVLCAGCMDEKTGPGEATPISRSNLPAMPSGPPQAIKPVPAPVAEAPRAPSGPAGLTRSKVGDLVEFSWSRVGAVKVDPGAAMAMVMSTKSRNPRIGPNDLEKMKDPAQMRDLAMPGQVKAVQEMPPPKATVTTGTLSIVRIEPETPFTFRVELKDKDDTEQKTYAYGPDIAVDKVLFRTDPDDPKKKAKAAGMVFDCVESQSRLVDPNAASLALSGGLVSETSVETHIGAVSVALTRVGTGKATASSNKPRVLDTFETPIAVAMQQVEKFGVVDPGQKAAAESQLQTTLRELWAPCVVSLKPRDGLLEGVVANGKLETLIWERKPAPKAFDKCARGLLKKVKLPREQVLLKIQIGEGDRDAENTGSPD